MLSEKQVFLALTKSIHESLDFDRGAILVLEDAMSTRTIIENYRHKLDEQQRLKNAAYAQARQIVRSKLQEQLDESVDVDKVILRKEDLINEVAQRIINKNRISKTLVTESNSVNSMFVEYFGDSAPGNSGSTGERSDNPIVSSGKKVPTKNSKGEAAGNAKGGTNIKGSPIIQYGKFGEDLDVNSSEFRGLVKKADKSDIDLEILGEVYNRGLDAWTEDLNVSSTQYAFARVNSYINQGKTYFNEDADLHEKRGLWDNIHAKQERIKAGSGEHMRKPGSKGAPTDAALKAAQESVDESKNTPYVKPQIEKGQTKQTAWKASNKHGRVKYFGLPFKKAAEKHAFGVTNESYFPGNDIGARVDTMRQAQKKSKEANHSLDHHIKNAMVGRYETSAGKEVKGALLGDIHQHIKDWSNHNISKKDLEDHLDRKYKHENGFSRMGWTRKGQNKRSRASFYHNNETYVNEETELDEHIVKVEGGYRLVSKSTGKNLGTYPTREGAEKREKQVQYFKHQNEETELDEVFQNDIVKSDKLKSRTLGKKLGSGHKMIGTLPGGHEVHFKVQADKHIYRVAHPETKEVNTVLTTWPKKNNAEEVDTLVGNENSPGAHHLYQHLVLKHDKILSSKNQSAGARRVWDKAAKHPRIHVHGYDPKTKQAFHMKPTEDEHYSSDKDYNSVEADKEKSPKRDQGKYNKELKDILSNDERYVVMHKKGLKEDTDSRVKVQGIARGLTARNKIQNVERTKKPTDPASAANREQEISKNVLEASDGVDPNKPENRLIGTDSLVKILKKATPGQNLDEAFNIAYAAGIGQTFTAADLGIKMQGGFAHHPSVLDEIEEDVTSAEKAPVIVPAHLDAYGNVIPAKSVLRKLNRKIIKSGNVHNGDTDQTLGNTDSY